MAAFLPVPGPSPEESLQACLNDIALQPDFPGFTESLQFIMALVASEDTSIRNLTNAVLRDYSLTLKLLRTANSPLYNRSGRKILSISHAVAMLGIEAVRDLAGSLVYFDHFRKKSPGLKELIVLSLLTATHAREVAQRVNYPRPEEAYLCGMFRNLGEILLACYRPQDYAQVLAHTRHGKLSIQVACNQIVKFSYEDLGLAVARQWRMPDAVTACQQFHLGMRFPARDPLGLLQALTSFSHALTTAIHRHDTPAGAPSVRFLIEDYSPVLKLDPGTVREISDAAITETAQTSRILQVGFDQLRLRAQVEIALEQLDQESPSRTDEDLLGQLTTEVGAVLDTGHFDLNSLVLMIIEAIQRGGGFDRVLFGLVDPDRTQIIGRTGLGDGIDSLIERFRFPLSIRGGPVAVSLLRKSDLLVGNDRDDRYEHAEFMKLMGAPFFGLYPVNVDGRVIGCLYFDRREQGRALSARQVELLGRLRDQLAQAVATKRPRS
ncbi:MAG TPA: HDOD domain-containing protein [Terriglobales bacterium]|jgi:HD-like signal output (HDOD) protein